MARQMVVKLTCDLCGVTSGVRAYRIAFTTRGAPRQVDLCKNCAAPLWELRDRLERRPDRRRRKVTVDEK